MAAVELRSWAAGRMRGSKAEAWLLYLAGALLIAASLAAVAGWWLAFGLLLVASVAAVAAYLATGQVRLVAHLPQGHPWRLPLTRRQVAATLISTLSPVFALVAIHAIFSSSSFVTGPKKTRRNIHSM